VLAALREVSHAPLRTLLASFIERHVAGREADIAKAAPGADPDTAVYLMQLLGRMGTPGARQAIEKLAQQSEDMNVCVEARLLLAPSPEHAVRELNMLLENTSALVRMAALRASTRHSIRNVWPTVARIIAAKHFNDLGSDERRELLRACVLLSPERGEPMLLELAKKGGVLTSGEREATRAVAAELLGELSRTRSTAMALQEIANARWGVSEETRNAAANAAKRIGIRLSQSQGSVLA
ncbi:MAG TPA: hypothetical protein VM925_31985, partial [Labilithrix sp.]|nr:hypothetical protein [Labilithrix sp.]